MGQDLRKSRSHEVVDEVGNPRRVGDLLGETLLFTYFKAPGTRERRACSAGPKVEGVGAPPARRCGPVSKEAGGCRREQLGT
jgi:hypothetical protein